MSDNQFRTAESARRTAAGAGQPNAAGWFAALAVVLALLALGLAFFDSR